MNFLKKLLGGDDQNPSFKNEEPIKDEEPTYLAIDFETANGDRVSACALGLAWLKNGKIIHSESHFIKPPAGQKFSPINVKIHGIKPEYVRDSPTFGELWSTHLEHIFNSHHLILHNSSMDAAV